jgi:hypothetical protein
VVLDGEVYSLQPETGALQLVPSSVVVEEDDHVMSVGNDIYVVTGYGTYQIVNVVTGEPVDLSRIPGQAHWVGSGVGDQVVAVVHERIAYKNGEGSLSRVVALDPGTSEVRWSWSALLGDPLDTVLEGSLGVSSVRQNMTKDRVVVHTSAAEALGQLAVVLDEGGAALSPWPPAGPTEQPLAGTDNLSVPPFVGQNLGWFDDRFMVYDLWPEPLRLRLSDPISGESRDLLAGSVLENGNYVPVADGEHCCIGMGRKCAL